MASHPAMLLDPKGAKRQAQSNGNHPDSSSPALDLFPMDSPNIPCEVPKDASEPLTLLSDLASPHSPGFSSPGLPPGLSADLSSPVHFSLPSMDTSVMSTEVPVSIDPPVNSDPQNGDIAMFGEFSGLDVPRVDSAAQIDTLAMAAETTDPYSVSHSRVLFSPIAPPALGPMSTDEPESLGLLLEGTGKQNGNLSIPVSPMAPAGTANVSRFRGPTPRSPATVISGISTPAPQASPNMTVQFTTTHDDDNESDAKRSYHEISDNEDSFDSHNLISNVYGAETRKRQPVKKIKTASEQASAANTPVSVSGDSGLGKWMKEGEDKPASVSTGSDVVDLTEGKNFYFFLLSLQNGFPCPNTISDVSSTSKDDDEIQCTGSTDLSTQRVCYGKIDGAMIISHLVPKPADTSISIDENAWPSLKVELQRPPYSIKRDTQIDVIDPHGQIFGKIDAKTAQGLCALLDDPATTTVEVSARLNTRKKLPDEVIWGPSSSMWHATITVYGQRQRAESIGKFLAHRNVWLGTPNSVESGTPTFNPHAELRRQQAAVAAANLSRERLGPTIRYESRTAEEVNDAVTKMFDQLIKEDIPTMEPTSHILTPLLHHQKQALWFMTEKEQPRKFGPREEDNNSLWREVILRDGRKQYKEIISGIVMDHKPKEALGGLLADMMGLGKTLSILSLITASLDQAEEWTEMAPHPKLVRDYPGIRNTKTTLLVAPLSAVSNWTTQIKDHLKERALSVCVFHGPSRTTDLDELSEYDLIITTYSTIHSEIAGRGARSGRVSLLSKMNMFRIVLDEAHTIRERNAAQTKAIIGLHANRRWSVTGTPIQNRMDDLYSVTNFLQIYPYSERVWFSQHIASPVKSGNPTLTNLRVIVDSFTLRRVKDRIDLPPREENIITLEFTEKEKQLHEFFRNESQVMMRVIAGEDRTKMGGRMYHHVLKAMMILRQVSAHGKELLDTSDRERAKGLSVHDAIDLEEDDSDESSSAIDKRAYDMFQLMQQASQTPRCGQCNGRLEETVNASGEIMRNVPMAIFLPCWDVFCPGCFSGWKPAFDSGTQTEIRCPSCDGWISLNYSSITPAGLQDHEEQQNRERQARKIGKNFGEYEGPHTKTTALINYLKQSVEDSKELVGERPIKSVVFSAWTSHLDLIETALSNNGLNGFTRLDGTMSLAARTRALEVFAADDSTTILLATIGAGGVGLNLTSASRVFIMEPQYNPAAVAQAVDRVHRLGQTRPVQIFRLVMKDSIEEKIMDLAKKKQQEADMTMNRQKLGKKEVQEARMREYRTLFK